MKPHRIIRDRTFAKAALLFVLLAFLPGFAAPAGADTGTLATGAPDYSSGATALIEMNPIGGPRATRLDILPTAISDLIVRSHGEYFYRFERYKSDSVAKFHISDPTKPLWQYSTLDSPDQVSNNPHDLIFLNAEKAYMPMFGNSAIWVVNLNAANRNEFKTGTLDISSYQDSDGIPEAHEGLVVGDKLFVLIERLNRDSSWWPTNTAYVAVFDTATDTEIDTGLGAADGVKGIPLPGKGPSGIVYVPELNKIFIACAGRYPYGDPTGYEYTGGIVTLDPETYQTNLLIDDGDASNHPYGAIGGLEIASPTKGYFVGYAGYNNTSIYPFNPSTGEVGPAVPALAGKSVTVSTSGGLRTDRNGLVWITDRSGAQVVVIDPATETVDERVDTNLNPLTISFCADPGALNRWLANWYVQVLDRQATPDELARLAASLSNGSLTGGGMASMLLNGKTFTARGVTDEQYVNILFQAFQGVDAPAGEMAVYLDYLSQGGTRAGMLQTFIHTTTFWRMGQVFGIKAF